jgi:hypothetical protein
MIQQISFSNDYSAELCEFCGEVPSVLRSSFTCNNGTSMHTFNCYSCFFGTNTHINVSQPFLVVDCNTGKCIDCESPSVHKISGGDNADLYFCDTHVSPHAPCIKIVN